MDIAKRINELADECVARWKPEADERTAFYRHTNRYCILAGAVLSEALNTGMLPKELRKHCDLPDRTPEQRDNLLFLAVLQHWLPTQDPGFKLQWSYRERGVYGFADMLRSLAAALERLSWIGSRTAIAMTAAGLGISDNRARTELKRARDRGEVTYFQVSRSDFRHDPVSFAVWLRSKGADLPEADRETPEGDSDIEEDLKVDGR